MFEGMPRTVAEYWEVLPGPRDVCYSQGMNPDNETAAPVFTVAQAFDMLATAMENAAEAIRNTDSVAGAHAILQARAEGARELADHAQR